MAVGIAAFLRSDSVAKSIVDIGRLMCRLCEAWRERLGAMHVAKISRRHGDREYNSYLVRRSIREGRRVRHETVANVSGLPPEAIEALTLALKGVRLVPAGEAFEIVRSRKHGHVEAVLTAARRLGLPRLLDREPSRERDLCLAMIAGRVLDGGSKLACTRQLHVVHAGRGAGGGGRGSR